VLWPPLSPDGLFSSRAAFDPHEPKPLLVAKENGRFMMETAVVENTNYLTC